MKWSKLDSPYKKAYLRAVNIYNTAKQIFMDRCEENDLKMFSKRVPEASISFPHIWCAGAEILETARHIPVFPNYADNPR